MAKLIYAMLTSLDGYISDEPGNFDLGGADWAVPDEVADKIVYSSTLRSVSMGPPGVGRCPTG
jgi:hypothetical protein